MNKVLVERRLSTEQTVQIIQGDITLETTQGIVNAANEHLRHGAGVAGAILRRGGQIIQSESDEWVRHHGMVTHSHPAWTSGGLLAAKYVIHAVGPVWGDGGEDAKLSSAIQGSLEVADELGLSSISMPAISTGIFGFPKERAAGVTFSVIERYFSHHPSEIRLVRLVLLDDSTTKAFLTCWSTWSPKSGKSKS